MLNGRPLRPTSFFAGVLLLSATSLRAQDLLTCAPTLERSVASANGQRINAITIQRLGPDRLPGGISEPLHVITRESTIRNRLLFSVGDRVDTLRVAESVRQLRRLSYIAGATVTAACDEHGGVTLTVVTRDAWSIRPRLAFRSSAPTTVGLEQTNLFGTGRAGRLYARSDNGQLGIGAAYSDPTLFGSHAIGTVSHDTYVGGSGWGGSIRSPDAGLFAPWEFGLFIQHTAQLSVGRPRPTVLDDEVERTSASLLISRRIARSSANATYFQFGAEADRAAVVAGQELPIVGPPNVRRAFVGADIGLAHRSGLFIDVPWLLPPPDAGRQALTRAEAPLGFEMDGVVGIGRELEARQPAVHVDAWAGRVWRLGWRAVTPDLRVPGALLSADIWASGYRIRNAGEWTGGSLRTSLNLVAPASRGLWSARFSAEKLVNPDPDVRGLALVDPTFRTIPGRSALAEAAMTASVERSVHLRSIGRSYVLDAALFGNGSMRWEGANAERPSLPPTGDVPLNGTERMYVGSIGTGLRLAPKRFGPATVRFDVGFPVVRSQALRGRPFVSISIMPPFGVGRQRDERSATGNQ